MTVYLYAQISWRDVVISLNPMVIDDEQFGRFDKYHIYLNYFLL